jgi:hypothetical protein
VARDSRRGCDDCPDRVAVSVVMLGAVGPGGIAAGAIVSLFVWLLAPHLEAMGAGRLWIAAGAALAAAALLIAVGMATVRSSPFHPTASQIVYALDADSSDAWLAARGPTASQLTTANQAQPIVPTWLSRAFSGAKSVAYVQASRVPIEPPSATAIEDSTAGT